MTRSSTVLALVSTACASLAIVGCNQELKAKDEHIALIEDTNQKLTQDLAAARQEADGITRERNDLNEQLVACHSRVDELTTALNDIPEPTVTVTEGWQAVPGGAMIAIEGSVLFTSGKSNLRAAGRSTLDGIAGTIRSQYLDKDVFVFGHTDDMPIKESGWSDNFELSAQRALAVVRYLHDHGIAPARLVACGAGEHRPRAPNTTDDNRAKNRRVEIFAVDPAIR